MLRPCSRAIPIWMKYWLAWTVAGLFYITQDFMTRLSRSDSIPWRNVVVGWMAAMYVCAAFTPAILWLGRRWAVDGWRNIALHLGASVVFSLVSTALEVPVLVALGVPGFQRPTSIAADFWFLLQYDLQTGTSSDTGQLSACRRSSDRIGKLAGANVRRWS